LTDLSELLTGITLLLICTVIVIVSLPRHGKTVWFANKPFLAPAVSVLIICGLALGLIMLASYFTAIDEATLAG
jgi:hypothetical protein